jgi:hypothetical protein
LTRCAKNSRLVVACVATNMSAAHEHKHTHSTCWHGWRHNAGRRHTTAHRRTHRCLAARAPRAWAAWPAGSPSRSA